MKNFLLEQQQKLEKIALLTEFIRSNPDGRELKRALAVKMALEEKPYGDISQLFSINKSYITQYKNRFEAQGINGIKLGYQGAKSYLNLAQRAEVITWLQTKNYWDLDELVNYLDQQYGVTYRSKQSYYSLFSEAGISWKKSQKKNPKSDPELVKKKREEIREFIENHQTEIESGKLIVLFADECHLLWGDVCGYVWGQTDIRIEIPISNQKIRQTYFGALNYLTRQFVVRAYEQGNGSSTIKFMKYLHSQYPKAKIALIWDGAKYHQSQEVKDFLQVMNQGKEEAQWQFTCILFAPNAPEQNPVEDVWLQGKNFLRRCWHLCRSFAAIKYLFEFFTNGEKFVFPKVEQYTPRL